MQLRDAYEKTFDTKTNVTLQMKIRKNVPKNGIDYTVTMIYFLIGNQKYLLLIYTLLLSFQDETFNILNEEKLPRYL